VEYLHSKFLTIKWRTHPVPAPDSTNELDKRRINEGGNNQNDILFKRGNAISTAPINNGTKKLPKPPTIPGMLIILVYIIINIYIHK
jgi:hypothetical protein